MSVTARFLGGDGRSEKEPTEEIERAILKQTPDFFFFLSFFLFFFFFLGPHLWHVEVPGLGVESEL